MVNIESRILDKLDKIEVRVMDICIRLTKMEIEYTNHITEMQKSQDRKIKKRDGLLAILAGGVGVIEMLRYIGMI